MLFPETLAPLDQTRFPELACDAFSNRNQLSWQLRGAGSYRGHEKKVPFRVSKSSSLHRSGELFGEGRLTQKGDRQQKRRCRFPRDHADTFPSPLCRRQESRNGPVRFSLAFQAEAFFRVTGTGQT